MEISGTKDGTTKGDANANGVSTAAPDCDLAGLGLPPTPEAGLSEEEAAARLTRFGPNKLTEVKTSKLMMLLRLVSETKRRSASLRLQSVHRFGKVPRGGAHHPHGGRLSCLPRKTVSALHA